MSDILKEICENKLNEVAAMRGRVGFKVVRAAAESSRDEPRGFLKAIERKVQEKRPALIAEVKKRSPSKGIIRENFDPAAIALAYEKAGATCVSVLTDEKYFGGNDEYFADIREKIKLPMIRKDFMLEPYQIYESRALGADCILLIMAALEKSKALELEEISLNLGMDVLIEVHDEKELEIALQMRSKLIGVNNRSLKTFETSLDVGKRLSKMIPDSNVMVCESGIYKNADIKDMQKAGFVAFLVGESLMREADIEKAVKELIGN